MSIVLHYYITTSLDLENETTTLEFTTSDFACMAQKRLNIRIKEHNKCNDVKISKGNVSFDAIYFGTESLVYHILDITIDTADASSELRIDELTSELDYLFKEIVKVYYRNSPNVTCTTELISIIF